MKGALFALAALVLAGCASESDPGTRIVVGPDPTPSTSNDPMPSDDPRPTPRPTSSPRPSPSPGGGQPTPSPDPDPDPPAEPEPRTWPELGAARIRPGVQVDSDSGGCTSNFVFTSPDSNALFLGFAAHCVADSPSSTSTNGCDTAIKPFAPGETVDIEGAAMPGLLVYSSWHSMQAVGEGSQDACRYNDFAVAQIDPTDEPLVHPAMRRYGGPTELCGANAAGLGDHVLTYGNSGLRFGVEAIRPREGYVTGSSAWSTTIYTTVPGVPGDSGSAVILDPGCALGVLVTLQSVPPGANGVTNVARALEYAAQQGWKFELATWEIIDPGVLP